jgi:hypothetical protein
LTEKSRVTAFVVDEHGTPSVECWEISSITASMEVQRVDGSTAVSHAISLARKDDLDSLDILTWPAVTEIWPPANGGYQSKEFDLSNTFRYVSAVQ